jgi:hypothetical protein
MFACAVNAKIGKRLVRTRDSGTHTGVCRPQSPIPQARPIAADRQPEAIGVSGLDVVIDRFDPLCIGTETRRPCEVECEVYAQTIGFRERIDEVPERGAIWQPKIRTLAKICSWHTLMLESRDVSCQCNAAKTRAVRKDGAS